MYHSGFLLDVLNQHPVISRNEKTSSTYSSQGSSIVFWNHSLFTIYKNATSLIGDILKYVCFSLATVVVEVKCKGKMYVVIHRDIQLGVLYVKKRNVCMWQTDIFKRSSEALPVYACGAFRLETVEMISDLWSVCIHGLCAYILSVFAGCGALI